jgi:oxygen-independent coproporphyrinogen-3 oxidase
MNSPTTKKGSPFALYVHVPFCQHKCPYCDFNTYAIPQIPELAYTEALLTEFKARVHSTDWKDRSVKSVYFGGGTPSLFSPENLRRVLDAAAELCGVIDASEISLEANPTTLSVEYLEGLLGAGVTRLSIGAQSFQAHSLKILGRNHAAEDVRVAFRRARELGFQNLSIDLLYGSPNQTVEDFQRDIDEILILDPEHISSYCLSMEPGTPYFQAYKKGSITVPPEEVVLEMMDILEDQLSSAGFEQYELSNFGKPGFRSSHNWAYWEGEDYLGLGAGAHSYVSEDERMSCGRRWSNVAFPERYQKLLQAAASVEAWSENLKEADRRYEFFFLGLRKGEGVSEREYFRRFGSTLKQDYAELLAELSEGAFLEQEKECYRLTRKGRRLSDSVFARFAP